MPYDSFRPFPVLDDASFPAEFEVNVRGERPADHSELQFRPPEQREPATGLEVEVTTPAGSRWTAVAQTGAYEFTKLIRGPTKEHLCIVDGGYGYIAPILAPEDYLFVRVFPILDVFRVPGRDLLVFADYSDLTAYSPSGLAWRARNVALDSMRITRVSADRIEGLADGDDVAPPTVFAVDTRTGDVAGGYAEFLRETRPY